jgi:hypothetical protein
MILGIDWLEVHNPMKVDWLNKWMVINYHGDIVQLQGLQTSLHEHSLIEVLMVSEVETVHDQT